MTDKQLDKITYSIAINSLLICSVICYTNLHYIWGTIFLIIGALAD